MAQEFIPFSQIIFELTKLCNTKATGTFFVVTKAKKSAQIAIENGEIVFIYFSNKRGQDALELMSTIKAGKFRFQLGSVTTRRSVLPPTKSILQALGEMVGQSPMEMETLQPISGSSSSLSQEQKNILEECLAEYVGPIAAIICEDHFSMNVDFSTTIDLLTAEISSADQKTQFRKKVLAQI